MKEGVERYYFWGRWKSSDKQMPRLVSKWHSSSTLGGEKKKCIYSFSETALSLRSPVVHVVKNLPAKQEMRETRAGSMDPEDPLEKGIVTHFTVLKPKGLGKMLGFLPRSRPRGGARLAKVFGIL